MDHVRWFWGVSSHCQAKSFQAWIIYHHSAFAATITPLSWGVPTSQDFPPAILYAASFALFLFIAGGVSWTLFSRSETRRMGKAVRLQKGRILWLSLTDSIYRSDTRTQRADEVREWLTDNEALFTQHQFTIVDKGISAACDHQLNLVNNVGMRSSDEIENARQVMRMALAKVEK